MDTKKLLSVIGLILILNTTYLAQELKLELTIDKEEYVEWETIIVILKVINTTNQDIIIDNYGPNPDHNNHGFYPIVLSEEHPRGLYKSMTSSHLSYSEYKLVANDTAYYSLDLSARYSNASSSTALEWRGEHTIKPGNYTFQYELVNGNDKKKYLSNKVEFSIIPPNENERKIFLEFIDQRSNKDNLMKMLKKYSNSPFNVKIFKSLLWLNYSKQMDLGKLSDEVISIDTSGRLHKLLLYSSYLTTDEKERIIRDKIKYCILKDPDIVANSRNLTKQRIKSKEYSEKIYKDKKSEQKLNEKKRSKQNEK